MINSTCKPSTLNNFSSIDNSGPTRYRYFVGRKHHKGLGLLRNHLHIVPRKVVDPVSYLNRDLLRKMPIPALDGLCVGKLFVGI